MANPFTRLMLSIKPYLPGVLDDAVKTELYMMCYDFFKWSDAWEETIEMPLNAGDQEYSVYPAAGRIQKLMYVRTKDNIPVNALMPCIPTVRLSHPVNTGVTLYAIVSNTVTDPTTRDAFPIIPMDIVEANLDTMISGILSRMMSQPSKPYTNTQMAAYHLMKFKGGCARTKNEMKAKHTQGVQPWVFPQSFANR